VHVVLQPGLHTTEVFDHLLILRFGEKFAIRISPDVEKLFADGSCQPMLIGMLL